MSMVPGVRKCCKLHRRGPHEHSSISHSPRQVEVRVDSYVLTYTYSKI